MSELTKIHGEDCERVVSFDDLHQLDIVWLVGCPWCGGDHRYTLFRWVGPLDCLNSAGCVDRVSGWEALPPPNCSGGDTPAAIKYVLVRDNGGALYRVVNPSRADADDQEEADRRAAQQRKRAHAPMTDREVALIEEATRPVKHDASKKG